MRLIIEERKGYSQSTFFNQYLLLVVVFFGFVLNLYEVYLQFKNSSLCKTDACLMIHLFDRLGILNYLGVLVFAVVLGLTLLDLKIKSYALKRLRLFILGLCLVVEGYFIGFQAFFLQEYCQFCLVVALTIFLAFVLDVFSQKAFSWGFLGFSGFLALFTAVFLVNISLKPIFLDYPVVVYQQNCPNCKVVEEYVINNKIPVRFYEVSKVYALMRIAGIREVPTLLYREDNSLLVLVGKNTILNWLKENYPMLELSQGREFSKNLKEKDFTVNASTEKPQDKKEPVTKEKVVSTEKVSTEKSSTENATSLQKPSSLPFLPPKVGDKEGKGEACLIEKGCN
ncbi:MULTISPECIES: hypothetical protein [Thermodesulfobacterium]|jgi:hypothetical protein|uniref:Vitamin K epoxide reductase domain-containing protein n=3 Tax=Thermodesulfobacteriaceae TaxID=188711 RepID=A0A075WVC8_9BACT|nr:MULTISPECIES: hypothetical protein [Thermodesulfobacterium]KUJ98094.1 MAG: Uncharacterized protein XD42_0247 [Thermodesulfobacterium sp. 37_54]KUK19554.1 MAG: Uncharacterized protein XD55_0379 [Thermodesulfobacterium commune]AIH04428.1 hypothetical protein HL41_06705 [Thermodesulfobacterium commune DSM 2178]KUK38460.1 MAG: Uncharacterized protein XD67_0220 [Thermodesulfobacterium commune]MBZ4681627.1 hypothetical protein [Thermodesulfobacterium sp.]